MKKIAERVNALQGSMTVEIDSLAKFLATQGRSILSLGVGEPDFDTPLHIREAAIKSINKGLTRYTSPDGMLSFKEAVCGKLLRENGVKYNTEQIIATSGAKQAIFNAISALVDEGDEVLIPSPYWVTYPELVRFCGGKPVFLECSIKDNFRLKAKQIEQAITPKTKALILNSPCNPTGVVYREEELIEFAKVVVDNDLYCISDEIYEHLIYDSHSDASAGAVNHADKIAGENFLVKAEYNFHSTVQCGDFTGAPSIVKIDGMQERTMLVNGFSKAFCMTGWRIGYVAAPADIAKCIAKMQGQTTHHPSNISQYGAIAALNGSFDSVISMRKEFFERMNRMIDALSQLKGIYIHKPEGAFYVFVDVSSVYGKTSAGGSAISNSIDFCKSLLDEHGVVLVPGIAFGLDSCVRFSFTASLPTISIAIPRFAEFWEGMK